MSFSIDSLENLEKQKEEGKRTSLPLLQLLIYGNKSIKINDKLIDDVRGMDIINKARVGIDYKQYHVVFERMSFNSTDLSKYLQISKRTLEKKKQDKLPLSHTASDRLLELAELYDYGIEVFANKEKFEKWMNRKSLALGGIIPKDLLDTSHGIRIVRQALGRIEHGVFG
tara:strand:- start:3 stop:512 length:510 start_codon:yes stop_codon:yes gene_type:complete